MVTRTPKDIEASLPETQTVTLTRSEVTTLFSLAYICLTEMAKQGQEPRSITRIDLRSFGLKTGLADEVDVIFANVREIEDAFDALYGAMTGKDNKQ